ncbi:porphobilinogen deaminase, dipyromethane cofactor binding domain-containing protein [Elsinoe ampelina]|uniref:Porphobilinogen deaminase n=1 Tax=Elsinoe ampelina TaxID=302913 RepID=A0A6A6GJ39_9PEZI|nr:porphobilinogen deaminase, dipyromethane cofactor binding domain-containing protein [Elsinoe ampelina]
MTTVTIPSDPTTPLDAPAPARTTPLSTTIRIATRKSTLARVQTALVSAALTKAFPSYTTQIIALDTVGDVDKSTPLHSFNAKALWTTELEDLLEKGEVDMIVHSLKDMPTQLPRGLVLGCVTEREDARDAVCIAPALEGKGVKTLGQLERGSVVGTSSLRRSAQLKRRFPGLEFKDVRGNVGTRLGKLDAEGGEYAALILAAAGLRRLGLERRISSLLSSGEGGVLHAVGQGALGIEIRGDDERMREVCEGIGEERSWRAALAERSVMRTLEGGCSVPIGVETEWVKKGTGIAGAGAGVGVKPSAEYDGVTGLAKDEDERSDELLLRGIVVSLDGQQAVEAEMRRVIKSREEADEFGWDMAQKLVEGGAAKILEDINLNRKIIQEQGGA